MFVFSKRAIRLIVPLLSTLRPTSVRQIKNLTVLRYTANTVNTVNTGIRTSPIQYALFDTKRRTH